MKKSWVCVVAVGLGLIVSCVGDDPRGSDPGSTEEAGVPDPREAGPDGSEPPAPGSGPVVTDIHVAGTRLEPTFFLLDDGTRFFDTWFDKELNARCSFQVQRDGTFACVPDSAQAGTFGYATSTCDGNQAAWFPQGCSKVPAFITSDLGNDGCFPDVYRSGATLPGAYQPNEASVCQPLESQGGLVFERREKLDPSTFVQARLVEWAEAPAASSRTIRALFLRGSDGSYGFGRWVLATADAACKLGIQPYDPTVRCYPASSTIPLDGYFSDPSCSTALLFEGLRTNEETCTGALPRIAATQRLGTCDELTGIDWATAAGVGEYPFFYRGEDGTCTAGASPIRGRLQGAALPIEAFGSATPAAPDPKPSVTALLVDLPDGTRAQRGYYDGARRTECAFGRASDLSLRCLPVTSARVETVFEDAACTVPTFVTRVLSSEKQRIDRAVEECLAAGGSSLECASDAGLSCAPPPKPAYALSGNGAGCALDSSASAWQVGDAVGTYWLPPKGGPGCVEHVVATGEAVYRVTEIAARDLPQATAGATAQ